MKHYSTPDGKKGTRVLDCLMAILLIIKEGKGDDKVTDDM